MLVVVLVRSSGILCYFFREEVTKSVSREDQIRVSIGGFVAPMSECKIGGRQLRSFFDNVAIARTVFGYGVRFMVLSGDDFVKGQASCVVFVTTSQVRLFMF